MSVVDVVASWAVIDDALGLSGPVRDDAHHAQLLAFVDAAFEQFGNDDRHPVFALVALVSERIRDYEAARDPWPALPPHELLRVLMDEHDIRQSALPKVGTQSVVSEVLAGKRALNLRQVKALAERFGVPMAAFAG